MTTNHRPTLESKRGKSEAISNTISHSRSLPQHTTLKFRRDIREPDLDPVAGKQAVKELKRDLAISDNEQVDSGIKEITNAEIQVEEGASDDVNGHSSSGQESNFRISEDKDEYTSSEYGSDDDSDDETAKLMEELAKIKKERQEEKERLELQSKIDKSKTSNPLVQVPGTHDKNDFKVKKSWRNSTAFKKQNSKTKNEDETFTNDTLKSDFHQKFLSKYVR